MTSKHTATRREFLAWLSLTAGGLIAGCRQQSLAHAPEESGLPDTLAAIRSGGLPNIILILTDDHRWDHMSFMGHPFLETPNFDQLAADGVVFENAFVTTSLCSPSRASILTGLYASGESGHQVTNNLTPWSNKNQTFFEALAAAGYRNAFIGKWHMPGDIPVLKDVDRFVTFDIQGGQGRYFDCPLIMDGTRTERPGTYITTDLTDLAIQFIQDQRKNPDNPFCLYLSHKAVHHPFQPPPELDNLYSDADLSGLPDEYFSLQTLIDRNLWEGAIGPMERHYRNYCETIVAVDNELGRLLKELDALAIADNTIIIYTSDNGYSWGEHIVNGKRWATEENIRVPFIVYDPTSDRRPGRRSQMILNVDIAPTILDLAGIPAPGKMQGKSIRPLLDGTGIEWRDAFLYEYFEDFPYNVPAHRAIRTEQYLYIEYDGGMEPELFDIVQDPRTLNNIIGSQAGQDVLPELQQRLRELEGEFS